MQKVLLDKVEIEDLLDGVYRIHKRLDKVDNVIKANTNTNNLFIY